MTTYTVRITLLDRERARSLPVERDPTIGGRPDAVMAAYLDAMYDLAVAGSFVVEAESPEAAAELAFEITNSYPAEGDRPEELHCPERYRLRVKGLRIARNRSLSVGDLVHVSERGSADWTLLSVATAGFKRVA